MLIAAGIFASAWRPSPDWVESSFSNGYYPRWQHAWAAFTSRIPFAVGDVVILIGIALIASIVVHNVRRARAARSWVPLARMFIGIAAVCGFYAIWFYAGWGFGYDRASLQTRTAYNASRVTPAAVTALRNRAIAEMNRLAPAAHRLHNGDDVDYATLYAAWLPAVQRLGDGWIPNVSPAKLTLAGFFMDKNATSGFTNPFTLETQLAPDLLWFERPFSQAHEWSHVAGYNREDEANYIAALTCMRDSDVVAQYSGWLEIFLYLPGKKHYARSAFVPEVWADFEAIRERNAHFVNLDFSRFSWHVYNNYLKGNHIASGVQNYNEVTRLLVGIPLDAQGLPVRFAST